jgi:BetI-type transcriptional repressor, C-terminal
VVQEWILWMEFWIEALHSPEMRPVNEELYGHWRAVVTDIIVAGQLRGEFKEDLQAKDIANRFIALLDGLAIQVLLHSEQMTVGEMRRICCAFIDAELDSPALAG